MKISRKKQNKRGSVLLLTFFIIVLLSLLGTGFLALLPVEMKNARSERTIVQTSFAADAAVQLAMNSLADNPDPDLVPRDLRSLGEGWELSLIHISEPTRPY